MKAVLASLLTASLVLTPFAGPVAAQGDQGVGLEMSQKLSSLPVEITSDDLSFDQKANKAIFTGNVVAVQGSMTLTADKMEVFYTRNETTGANEISRVIATGQVVMVQEFPEEPERSPDAYESGVAVYNFAEETIVMTQDVLVVREDTVMTSDKMTYHLPTGRGVMEGRVTTLLVPKSDE